jgi:hypothetical protein
MGNKPSWSCEIGLSITYSATFKWWCGLNCLRIGKTFEFHKSKQLLDHLSIIFSKKILYCGVGLVSWQRSSIRRQLFSFRLIGDVPFFELANQVRHFIWHSNPQALGAFLGTGSAALLAL